MNSEAASKAEVIQQLKAARRVSTPLVALATSDQGATCEMLVAAMNGAQPIVQWDVAGGLRPRNEKGHEMIVSQIDDPDEMKYQPMPMLEAAKDFPPNTIVVVMNAQRFWNDPIVMQGVWNLRDEFKRDRRMMVMMMPSTIGMPIELRGSVISFEERLPNDEQLRAIIEEQIDAASEAMTSQPTDDDIDAAVAALRGCAAFQAEQLAAMALRQTGIALDDLRSQAQRLIDETPGLTVDKGKETFADIGGLAQVKKFGGRLFAGPKPPRVVVRVEELEKTMGGSKTDMSGTSQDALQVILSAMEDNGWNGIIAYGAPGSGKSLFSKSLANEHEALPLQLDLNATKGSLVGQSEQQVRKAVEVIKTIGAEDVFFVASVNSLDAIPPELQRRFRCGVWFFDVPSKEERDGIWKICRDKFGIDESDEQPADENMTGADIRNICEMAYKLACPLREAAEFVVPLKTSSPDAIETVRQKADGRFLSTSEPGVYRRSGKQAAKPATAAKTRRKVTLD